MSLFSFIICVGITAIEGWLSRESLISNGNLIGHLRPPCDLPLPELAWNTKRRSPKRRSSSVPVPSAGLWALHFLGHDVCALLMHHATNNSSTIYSLVSVYSRCLIHTASCLTCMRLPASSFTLSLFCFSHIVLCSSRHRAHPHFWHPSCVSQIYLCITLISDISYHAQDIFRAWRFWRRVTPVQIVTPRTAKDGVQPDWYDSGKYDLGANGIIDQERAMWGVKPPEVGRWLSSPFAGECPCTVSESRHIYIPTSWFFFQYHKPLIGLHTHYGLTSWGHDCSISGSRSNIFHPLQFWDTFATQIHGRLNGLHERNKCVCEIPPRNGLPRTTKEDTQNRGDRGESIHNRIRQWFKVETVRLNPSREYKYG